MFLGVLMILGVSKKHFHVPRGVPKTTSDVPEGSDDPRGFPVGIARSWDNSGPIEALPAEGPNS